ncbi:MAG TPA: hypothetical protein VKI64_05915 [Acidimicrobiales bacterium]|nr:hypothetical protein [Acidimicrobiales bacterium]
MASQRDLQARLARLAGRVAETEDRVADVLDELASRGGDLEAARRARAGAARQFAREERAMSAIYQRQASGAPASA